MTNFRYLLTVCFIVCLTYVSCNDDNDNGIENDQNPDVSFSDVKTQNFIWQGLNLYYLWKDDVADLDNSKEENEESYLNLLSTYDDPEDFFESLIYDRSNTDKWSWIVDDYIALQNSFAGISTSNGMKYGLTYKGTNDTDIIGYVKYVLPNSDASGKDVQRGYMFDVVDGQQLTVNNYKTLLEQNTYTLYFTDLNDGNFVSNGKSAVLTKSEYSENPVYITKTFNIDSKKIGYLMYNSFTANYDNDLNAAFAQLKSNGVTDLVLDLRYNSGGSVRSATYLAGMITGQFTGDLFTKEKWNNELQEWFEQNHPDWLNNYFVDEIYTENASGETLKESINSLNLSNVYVIITGSSASASELIINGLNPYINVVTVGEKTAGKYTASITLYDTENFNSPENEEDAYSLWAMQPIVLEEINNVGENDKDGFEPTVETVEYVNEMQELGLETEPLLAEALALITGVSAKRNISKEDGFESVEIKGYKGTSIFENQMYIDKKLPEGLR